MMTEEYFQVEVRGNQDGAWFLHAPTDRAGQELDGWRFTSLMRYAGPLPLVTARPRGRELKFSLGEYDYPVVDEEIRQAIMVLDDHVQFLPIKIPGVVFNYFVANVTRAVKCADLDASEFDRFGTTSGPRPELAGQIKIFYSLRLKKELIPKNCHIFRLWEHSSTLLISNSLRKNIISLSGDDGVEFELVT